MQDEFGPAKIDIRILTPMPNTIATCTQARQFHRSIQQRLERQLIEEFRVNASTLIVLNLPPRVHIWSPPVLLANKW